MTQGTSTNARKKYVLVFKDEDGRAVLSRHYNSLADCADVARQVLRDPRQALGERTNGLPSTSIVTAVVSLDATGEVIRTVEVAR